MKTPAYLYHGTQSLVARLEPRPARGADAANDRLCGVYASQERKYAMAFGLPIVPDERGGLAWSLDYVQRIPRIAIHAGLLDMTRVGYLYRVRADTFVPLGDLQWVSYVPVVPQDYEVIDPAECVQWIAARRTSRRPGHADGLRHRRRAVASPVLAPRRTARRIDFGRLWRRVTAQFRLTEKSPHGPDHWRRVERMGLRLATRTQADVAVVRLFAVFHDCRRVNDARDDGHGARGADFAASLRGRLFDVPDETFERLRVACTLHTDGFHHEDPTIGTCWDADRLDLGRVGVVPDPRFMSTDAGRQMALDLAGRAGRRSAHVGHDAGATWLREYGAF